MTPTKWDRHATRAAKALLREEGKALRDLRSVARAASQRLVHAIVLLPPEARRQSAERVAAMLRHEGERVAREMTAAVSGVRLASKTTSHGLLVAEWTDVRHELRKAGYRDPGGIGTHPTLAPTDDAAAHRTGQSFAAGWSSLVLAAAWTWSEGTAESIAPAVANIDIDGRVRRIAATEAAQSFEDARDEGMGWLAEQHSERAWYPFVLKRWDASNDRKVCRVCAKEDGETVLLGATFSEGNAPGYAHSFCLVPGTPVAVPGGEVRIEDLRVGDVVVGGLTGRPRRVTALHRTPHRGDVYVIRANGHNLRITGNHPVLTPRGWVPAEMLKPGDEVIRHLPESRVLPADGSPIPSHHFPAFAAQEGITLGVDPLLKRGPVPVAWVDLNVNPRSTGDEVQVVAPYGDLSIDQYASRREGFLKHTLDLRERLPGLGFSPADQLRDWLRLPSQGFMASSGEASSAAWSLSVHTDHVGGRCAAWAHPCVSQGREDRRSADAESGCQCEDRYPLVDVKPPNGLGAEIRGSSHRVSLITGAMLATPIDSIKIEQYRGHVLNLSVEIDESYVAAGIAVHNCRCVSSVIAAIPIGRRETIPGRQVDDFNPRGPDEVPTREAA